MLSRFTCVWSHSRRSVFSCDRTPSLTCQSWCEYVLHTQFTIRQSNFECGYKEKPCIVRFFFVTTLKIQAVRGFDLNSPRNGYLNWKGGEKHGKERGRSSEEIRRVWWLLTCWQRSSAFSSAVSKLILSKWLSGVNFKIWREQSKKKIFKQRLSPHTRSNP